MNSDVVIVTGAGRGIGACTARLAASRGYSVCVNYLRNRDAAMAVVDEIRAQGGNAIAVKADIASEPEVVGLFETVDRELGRPSALVNNAARLEPQMRLESMDAARMLRVFAANAIGTMVCAREAVRRMSLRHGGAGGAIVNVSSGAARYGSPGEYVDYAASKGAVETFHDWLGEGGCRRRGFASTAYARASSTPICTRRAASRIVWSGSSRWFRCSAAASLGRWRPRSCGWSRRKLPT